MGVNFYKSKLVYVFQFVNSKFNIFLNLILLIIKTHALLDNYTLKICISLQFIHSLQYILIPFCLLGFIYAMSGF